MRLIDVLWLERGSGRVAGAFEVEHTTSIYSGIVRLHRALARPGSCDSFRTESWSVTATR